MSAGAAFAQDGPPAHAAMHPETRANARADTRADIISHGKFQNIRVYRPQGEVEGVVLLLSGENGWDKRAAQMARALTGQGAMVAGINTRQLMAKLDADAGSCVFPDGDLENLSRFVQAYEKLPGYTPPVLAGEGAGAALAYTVVAGTTADIFAGLLTFDFCPELALRKPLCKGAGANFRPRATNTGIDLLPAKKLRLPWIALQHRTDSELPGADVEFPSCHTRVAQAFVSGVPGSQLQLLPQASENPLAGRGVFPQWQAAYQRLNLRRAPAAAPVPAAVHDLPIVELPATGRNAGVGDQTMAVFLSGDGGWAGIDREIADTLAKNGVPVIGLDSLRYFWDARTPASAAADIARLMRFYMAQWHKSKVLLIGYSQGADVLPFIVNRLPAEARGQIELTAMLALGQKADFQFRLSNWIKNSNDGLPIQPEVDRLIAGKFLCVYGSEEKDSGCPAADVRGIKAVKLNGGHHFDGDNAGLARRILSAAR
ncbi:virulence factor family protein [Oxalobacteraceae bacterium CAVE-383]|nr:virulence factor family protein [Oxalobacteraceae bacterium CAVE-383]